jgi:putative ABC transport system substrate-binding protein
MRISLHKGLNRREKILIALPALLLCLFFLPLPAPATDIVLIKESDIKPYRSAIDGIKSSCTCSVLEFDLDDADEIEHALKGRPTAVVTVGTDAYRKARGIRNIPLVYAMVIPADTAGPQPDNISGVSMDIEPGEYISAITSLFPDAKRIGLLYDPDNTGEFVRDAEAQAREAGVALIAKSVRDPRRIPALLDDLRKKVDVFWMLPDRTVIQPETVDYLMLVSFQSSLPVFSFSRKFLDEGAAAVLVVTPFGMGVQAGKLVRSLAADKKGPLQVYAKSAKLLVNRKVCAKLGVRIDEETASRAEKVEQP